MSKNKNAASEFWIAWLAVLTFFALLGLRSLFAPTYAQGWRDGYEDGSNLKTFRGETLE